MAHLSQKAWIIDGFIKYLIVPKFDEIMYEKVLFACDLIVDLNTAVDEHVGEHSNFHVFGENGMLKYECKVLVTNSSHFLSIADDITLFEDSESIEQRSSLKLVKMNKDEINNDIKNLKLYQLIEQIGKRKVNNNEKTKNLQQEIEKEQLFDDSSLDDAQTFKVQEILDDASLNKLIGCKSRISYQR